MHQSIMNDELKAFQGAIRRFIEKDITPFHEEWEQEGLVPRAVWEKAGEQGYLCVTQAAEYGGMALDFRYACIVTEELARAHASGVGFALHSDIVAPYIETYGTADQKERWLPQMASGKMIGAISMSEPGAGSDLQGIRTTARLDGNTWVLDGSKTFVSNGENADVVVVVARSEETENAWQNLSLFVVERGMPGFVRGRKLDKIGLKAQDTTELHFEDCRLPRDCLLGDRGAGFMYLMNQLDRERLVIAVGCLAAAKAAFEMTVDYCQSRTAFSRPIGKFQNTRFKLAEMATEIEITEAFIDRCIMQIVNGESITVPASMAKYWSSEMLGRIVDQGVQFHGGYGFMQEYPISKAYLDARVQRIYGGTTEIMKEIIARSII